MLSIPVGAALCWIYLVWGSTYLSNRIALESMPPSLISGIRFLIAGSVLLLISALSGARLPKLGEWKVAAVPGVLMIAIGQGSMVYAGPMLPSGIIALLFAMLPIWTTLLQWAMPGGTRPSAGVLAGLLLGSAGMALLVGRGSGAGTHWQLEGLVAVVLGTLSWAVAALYMKRRAPQGSALQGAAMQMLTGGACQILVATLCGDWQTFSFGQITPRSGWAVTYLVIVASVITYPVYNWLVKAATPTLVATFAFVNPVVALYLGWLVLDEKMTALMVLSSVLIVCGVIAITFAQARANRGDRLALAEKAAGAGKLQGSGI
ncbi:drug/metabolite transporter (DMT)-like permease [Paucimonas lemoignei]|uniref:Drug/metabolite transporter (DMT)-like permease n=1 Tax=Paucimonas lemoignei TaxID=29443 RepID=A0A4R3HR90_PAULE|nr:EamA family transporter [Paucimonas lemoignei]TCS35160.1 drug/metabolite transporter (DMT)-like permease [Paucimonas lemoignei]